MKSENSPNGFSNDKGALIINHLIDIIEENKSYLSEIDGLIGDGDHGINMNKGFQKTKNVLQKGNHNFSSSAQCLANVLMNEVGGSMGPLYGMFFLSVYEHTDNMEMIYKDDFYEMLKAGLQRISSISDAKPGDKTLMDTLYPAVDAFGSEIEKESDFSTALKAMKSAAIAGCESTRDMQARKGRSARLGERSIGILDAGATSCCIILGEMADRIIELLNQ